MVSGIRAEDVKPNVFVILDEGGGPFGESEKMENFFRQEKDEALRSKPAWDDYESTLLATSGRAALTAALIYGKEPLLTGVVEEWGWRRKPVLGPSLLDAYRKSGYSSLFYGHWKLGDTHPYDPLSRGFDDAGLTQTGHLNHAWKSAERGPVGHASRLKNFTVWAEKGKPIFCLIDDRFDASKTSTAEMIKSYAISQMENKARPTVVIVIAANEYRGPKEGEPGFYDTLKWSLFSLGMKNTDAKTLAWRHSVRVDKDLSLGLRNLIGLPTEMSRDFYFFHKARWKNNESPEKYRHRGSLIVGKGHALVDGLELYPISEGLEPDLTKPLDIGVNKKRHSEMLTAHANWWQKTRKALHDPRAFSVGVVDQQVTRLTAEDWRPSKIIHKDGTSPSSQKIIFKDSVVDLLTALRGEEYRNAFPAYSGSWAVNVRRPGRYKITASLLPKGARQPEGKILAKLQGGQAFFKLGRNNVQLNLVKGASSVSVLVDADAGVTDLECWFTGQLALERELGAFFVEIQRVGDKKFDLKAKEQPGTGQ